ncbi:MAG: homoserine dehydrogenase, partial [Rhodobacteraceae bacterium]|nr:homoserine dehydrogenase [Paracoccaceae bacterium]
MTGVMASISSVLEKNRIGIESIIQKEVSESIARIAIITSIVNEKVLHESLRQLGAL